MADVTIDELRSRRDALVARLASPDAGRELEALKAEIGALFKTVEKSLVDMNVLRDDVPFGQAPGSICRQALPQASLLLLAGMLKQARPGQLACGFRILRVGGTEVLECAQRGDQRRLGVGRTAGFVEHAAEQHP